MTSIFNNVKISPAENPNFEGQEAKSLRKISKKYIKHVSYSANIW